jgi:hypothetical protein
VDRLVRKGLLTREETQQDRRVLKVGLTPEALEILTQISRSESERLQQIINRMNENQREALEVGMDAFLAAALVTPEEIDKVCLHCGNEHDLNCRGNLRYKQLTGRNKDNL